MSQSITVRNGFERPLLVGTCDKFILVLKYGFKYEGNAEDNRKAQLGLIIGQGAAKKRKEGEERNTQGFYLPDVKKNRYADD